MKNIQIITWTICLIAATFQAAGALSAPDPSVPEPRLTKTVHIADALALAYTENPQIRSAKEAWKQVIAAYRIETGYPDPKLSVTYFPSPIETRLGPQDWNLNLSQTVPFPGKLSRKGEIVASRARIARLKLDKTVREVSKEIIIAYQKLFYIQQAIAAAKNNFSLAKELLKIGETAYTSDQATFYDISKAQAQVAQIQYDILLLEELLATEKIKFNALLKRPPEAGLGEVKELKLREVAFSLEQILSLFLSHQEDMRIAEEQFTQSDARLQLSKYDRRPDFTFGLFYAGIGDPDVASPPDNAGDDALGLQFGINIPLWSGKNNGRVEKALAGKRRALAQKDQAASQGRTKKVDFTPIFIFSSKADIEILFSKM